MVSHRILKTTLEKELDLYNKFVEACQKVRACIEQSDLDLLRKHVHEQEDLVAALSDLESSRQLLVDEFAEQSQAGSRAVTLRKIAHEAEEPMRRELLELEGKLKDVLADIQRENKTNAVLLSEALKFVRGTFEILVGVRRKKDTYTAGGKSPEDVRASRNVLNRVA